ncbi:B3 domain-containing protein REM8 [Cardamine amara subsp. amara]|uniref:B3 domain-containing protein REM8 n=1 Tax=Cardamine amara subsp. amara TaxID=228776 RepID=A0ABD0ZMT0_CARAN
MENVSASSPTNPHFFQPLLPGFHSHLSIPTAFFSRHIEGTTNKGNAVAKLKSNASDITWEVKMDGRKLTQGWQKFATSHDLRVGDIVVFRHDGNLLFHVTSLGRSCCEIQYDDNDVIQISSDSDSENIHYATEGSTSSDHSCFVTCVTKSNLSKDILFLPIDFSRSNGLTNRHCEIILLNEDEKPWRLLMRPHKTKGGVYIRSGWRSFCCENRLRDNDILTFKLVKTSTTPVLQLLRSPSMKSQYRFLTLTLKPHNLKSYVLFLPGTFVRANGIRKAEKITLVDRYGIKRTTSLKPTDKYGRMRLGIEWREFCDVNGVKTGDSFKLELIKGKEDTATPLLKFCSKVQNPL